MKPVEWSYVICHPNVYESVRDWNVFRRRGLLVWADVNCPLQRLFIVRKDINRRPAVWLHQLF